MESKNPLLDKLKARREKIERFLEFFIVGLVLGVIEDVIAIKLATGAKIDFNIFKIAFLVALPFAIFSELIVDRPNFWKFWRLFPAYKEKHQELDDKKTTL